VFTERLCATHAPGTVTLVTADSVDTLTAAEIARLAGVVRSAVSNWQRRYPEFPKPVGRGALGPTFSRTEVEAWLIASGKADQMATAGRTDAGIQGAHLAPAHAESAFDRRGRELRPEHSIADLSPSQVLARVMVSLLPPSTTATQARALDVDDAVLTVIDGETLPVVLDPACSDGTLLMAVADRFGDQVRLAGQEIDQSAADRARLNLRSRPDSTPYDIQEGDSLLNNQFTAYLGATAAVVCEPPVDTSQWPSVELTGDRRWEFGIPSPRDAELVWVQHCYAHLWPRGVAVIAVSGRTCMQSSGQHVRASLVRAGALRDVIALPKGTGTEPDADLYLWVLQRPSDPAQYPAVRMVDLSRLGDAADVPHEFTAWERLFADADPTICRAVARLDLLDGDVNLLPSRYVTAHVATTAGQLAHVMRRLQLLYANVGQGMPRFGAPLLPVRHSFVTLAELERAGAMTFRSRDTTPRSGDVLVRSLGRPPVVASGIGADETGVTQIIEIDEKRLDSHFVATFLRVDAHATPVASTLGALSRDDLRRCRIPRIPLSEQRRYGDAFRQLQEWGDAQAALAKVSTHVIEQTIHALTTGVLAPGTARAPQHSTNSDPTHNETREP
jgi:type I restriction-modification system DNA methylase subunit